MTFARRKYSRATVPLTPATGRGVIKPVSGEVVAFPKDEPFRSEKWLAAVRSLHCMRCFKEGATQAAHRNQDKGMSTKTDDSLTAALCVACHAEIDQGKDMTRAERREALDVAILMTLRALARKGLVAPK